jgi:antitoxin (DNA-binding transcriptional repressor) of toxin-antitoxin stability system
MMLRKPDMSELSLDNVPGNVTAAAHEAARGQVVYLTEHGMRLAAIVPASLAAELGNLSPEALAEVLEDFADAAAAREARASVEAGEPLIPWEQVKTEAGL